MAEGRKAWAIPAIASAGVAWAIWLIYFSVYQVDDAFIVYRYARNIGNGLGIVFNPGERVEGVTCLLWTLLLAPFSRIGLPLHLVAPLLTALAGGATLALLPGAAARLDGRAELRWTDFVPTALLAASPSFAFWSVGALETVPYALLVTLALDAHLRGSPRGAGFAWAVWLGVAAWMRPEAPLLAAALVVHDLAARRPGSPRRPVVVAGGVFGALVVALVAFRIAYFGDWLPNTYYAKAGGPLVLRLGAGMAYSSEFAATLAPAFGAQGVIARLAGLAVLGVLVVRGARRERYRPLVGIVAAFAVAVVFEGGDWMVLHRFFVPALPAIALLAGEALAAIAAKSRGVALAIALLFAASEVTHGVRARDGANGLAVNAEGYRHAHVEVARFLSERARPGDAVALMDLGIIGYLTDLPVIDISGLTDREIARAPGPLIDKRYPVERLLERSPRFFVLVDRFPIDTRIALSPPFQQRYRLVYERNHRFNWTPPDSYVLHVFERKEAPAGP